MANDQYPRVKRAGIIVASAMAGLLLAANAFGNIGVGQLSDSTTMNSPHSMTSVAEDTAYTCYIAQRAHCKTLFNLCLKDHYSAALCRENFTSCDTEVRGHCNY